MGALERDIDPNWIVEPLSPVLGARVRGVDLASPLSPAVLDGLKVLLAQFSVLALVDQFLDPATQVELGTAFGQPYIHPYLEAIDGYPEVLEVLKEPKETDTFGGEYWHADITFNEPPASVSILQSVELPPSGGDTLFANQYVALETLPSQVRAQIAQLNAVHLYPGKSEDDEGAFAVHPVVKTHPITGRDALYVNAAFVSRFEGQTAEQSAPLLEYLFEHQAKPEFQCSLQWSDPMIALWDNQAVLHFASNDYFGYRRQLRRVTVIGRSLPSA